MRIRSHAMARRAYERVAARQPFVKKKEYGALAHKLPALILQNGLAQATGFMLAKGEAQHRALLDDLADLLGQTSGDAMHQVVIAADATQTMLLTRRALDAAGWIKRYVQGILKIDATGEESQA